MRIKLFEELKKETYLSAAKKLREKGHIRRADDLSTMAYKNVDRIDPNKYHINFDPKEISNSPKLPEIDAIFQIVDIIETGGDSAPLIVLVYRDIKVEIAYGQFEKTKYGFWIRQVSLKNDPISNWSEFKFKNRRDARNFKYFLTDQFPARITYSKLSLNDMYI